MKYLIIAALFTSLANANQAMTVTDYGHGWMNGSNYMDQVYQDCIQQADETRGEAERTKDTDFIQECVADQLEADS